MQGSLCHHTITVAAIRPLTAAQALLVSEEKIVSAKVESFHFNFLILIKSSYI